MSTRRIFTSGLAALLALPLLAITAAPAAAAGCYPHQTSQSTTQSECDPDTFGSRHRIFALCGAAGVNPVGYYGSWVSIGSISYVKCPAGRTIISDQSFLE